MQKKPYLRTFDLVNLLFVKVSFLSAAVFFNKSVIAYKLFFFYLGLLLFLPFFLYFTKDAKNRIALFFRDWYLPILFTFYYENTYHFAQLIFKGVTFDPQIAGIEQFIFGFQPSILFVIKVPNIFISEFLHFSYTAYYLFIPLVGSLLWFGKKHKEFYEFLFGIVLIMLSCYIIYSFFPVEGPIWYFNGKRADFNGFIFVNVIDYIVKYAEIHNAAFPSSHVALSVFILLIAYKYLRILFYFLLPVFIGLCFATVYIQAHYVIDIPAGLAYGIIFYIYNLKIKNFLANKFNMKD